MTVIAPLLMLVLWWVISRSLRPLERTRQQIARRVVDDLSPLSEIGLPDEVRPLVQEINLLFGRLQLAFDTQKAFVANAAHELRSPLTALKLQAQAIARSHDDGQRQQAVERLNQGIDRAIRLMNQLLLLARQEADAASGPAILELGLADLVHQVVQELLPQAQERAIDLGVRAGDAQRVRGDPDALRILLRNLLENAIKYTPRDGRVDVCASQDDAAPCLYVEDSGPGIPEPERDHVFARFFRGAQAGGNGSGLGLAIVQAIARRHQATVTLGRSEALGGLRVQVRFAASAGATSTAPRDME
jgi:two-component system OmpR family sensor kinase